MFRRIFAEDYTRLMLTSRNTKKKPQSPKKNKQASGSNEFEEPGKVGFSC